MGSIPVGQCLIAALVFYVVSAQINLICPDGWKYLDSGSCYIVFHEDEQIRTYSRAAEVCKNHGAHLAVIENQNGGNVLGREVMKSGRTHFWIGYRIKYDDVSRVQKLYNDKDGTEVSEGSLFWGDRNPDRSMGNCVYLSKNSEDYIYDVEYTAAYGSCESKWSFVCQREAAPEGSFFCAGGGYVNGDSSDVCDGRVDCPDGSDESHCPGLCRYKYMQSTGVISLLNYGNSTTCVWSVVTPEGTNAYLQFDSFETENAADYVQVFVGATTDLSPYANRMATLSGNLNSEDLMYRSHNNMLLVKFSSDSQISYAGFSARFGSFSDDVPSRVSLNALATEQTVTPPLSTPLTPGPTYLGSRDYVWVISAKTWDIITVQIMSFDESDTVKFFDGQTPDDKLVAELCSGCDNYNVVFSTGNHLSIFLMSDSGFQKNGFTFTYKIGCDVTLTDVTGTIFSPGYPKNIKYPNNQVCTWTIDTSEPISLFFHTDLNLQDDADGLTRNADYVQIFSGATDETGNAEHGTEMGFNTASLRNTLVQSSNGKMFIKFVTSPTLSERGFIASYSKGCEDPQYNAAATTGYIGNFYTASQRLACAEGYRFYHQAVIGQIEIPLICSFGGIWNYKHLPYCTRVCCGEIPNVDNAYIESSTGATFESVVTYQCYPGSTLQTSFNTITCQSDGQWSERPSCQASRCSLGQIDQTIDNGDVNIRVGQDGDIGTIVDYTCDPGFEIVGEPILFCDPEDGQWTNNGISPFCQRLTCFLPMIPNGQFTSSTVLSFDQSRGVTCNNGYQHANSSITSVTCKEDRSLTELPVCEDINECNNPNICEDTCTNTDGSYVCSCDEKLYTLSADMRSCHDIDECEQGTSNCRGSCENKVGGYTCQCLEEGTVLFTSDGLHGYKIPEVETGLLPSDTYHLNHSCVLVSCPHLTSPQNGALLKNRINHRYGDQVEFQCQRGFSANGDTLLTCLSDGSWSSDPPTCEEATCPTDNVAVANRAVFEQGPYAYGAQVELNCTVADTVKTLYRMCLYNTETGYRLQGAPYDCDPYTVDCGQPTGVPGLNIGTLTDTSYGVTFTFICSGTDQARGSSLQGGLQVTCGSDGHWDLGDLHCISGVCPDPGTPAGGYINGDSFADGSEVSFGCNGLGMSLTDSRPLRCNGRNWNGTAPRCIDTMAPVFDFSSCSKTFYPKKYDMVNSYLGETPSAIDNVGVKTITISPVDADKTRVFTEDINVTYTATDFQGNSATCDIFFKLRDEESPALTCPFSRIITLENEDDAEDFLLPDDQFLKRDNVGIDTFNVIRPPLTRFNVTHLYQRFTYKATATDAEGNENTCSTQLFVQPAACSGLSYPMPHNAVKSCQQTSTGFRCILTCLDGYVFRGFGYQRTVNCNGGIAWSENDLYTGCIRDVTPPDLACPESYKVILQNDDPVFEDFTQNSPTYSDINRPTISFIQQNHSFTASDLYMPYQVTVQAVDAAGNEASCSFEVLAVPAPCSKHSYPDPVFGTKTCSRIANGYSCVISCEQGYVLQRFGTTSRTVTCTDFGTWNPSEVIPACVLDTHPPFIKCPENQYVYLSNESDSQFINFSDLTYTAEDDGGIRSTTFSPSSYTFDKNNLNSPYQVTMQTLDRRGLSSNCNFNVITEHAACSPMRLSDPANGQKVCTPVTSGSITIGYTCTFECNPGYQFYSTANTSITLTCFDSQGWDLTNYNTGCVSETNYIGTVYTGQYSYTYVPLNAGDTVPSDQGCDTYYEVQQQSGSKLSDMASRMENLCTNFLRVNSLIVTFNTNMDVRLIPSNEVNIVYTFTIVSDPVMVASTCSNDIANSLENPNSLFELNINIPGNGTCPALTFSAAEALPAYNACPNSWFRSPTDDTRCLLCPPGTVVRNEQCEPCDTGTYKSTTSSTLNLCSSCGSGRTTATTGSTGFNQCKELCEGNSVSATGYVPCAPCPKGYYKLSSTVCQICPDGQTTQNDGEVGAGACVSIDEKEDCGLGTYDPNNNKDCELCPQGSYRESISTSCISCSQGTTYMTGATSRDACKAPCRGGTVSIDGTGISPCVECAKNTYSFNTTHCASCTATLGTGTARLGDCVSPVSLRERCPPGMFRNSANGLCEKCAVGTFSEQEEVGVCTSCGPGKSTYHMGANNRNLCFDECEAGFTSDTALSPCQPCERNQYYDAATKTCIVCPNGGTTLNINSPSIASCQSPCPAGYFSNSGYGNCRPCPFNHYQPSTTQTDCRPCSGLQYTNVTSATVFTQCQDAEAALCQPNPCGLGTCSISNHHVVCTCPEGYTGDNCESTVDHCLSDPCYYGGECNNTLTGFTCNCIASTGTFGDRCENLPQVCNDTICQNGGGCRNLINNAFDCLCPEGFTGDTCLSETPICPTGINNPCMNGGTCIDLNDANVRRKCVCAAGWTGPDCSENIDDCASNPCYHGGECVDLINDYRCNCGGDYFGSQCTGVRNACLGIPCGSNAQCIADYSTDEVRCICNPGFHFGKVYQYRIRLNTAPISTGTPTTIASVDQCRQTCDVTVFCAAFTYNSNDNTCMIYSSSGGELQLSQNNNFYTKESLEAEDDYWTPYYSIWTPNNINSNDHELRSTLNDLGLNICRGTEPINVRCRNKSTGNLVTSSGQISCTVDGLDCVGAAPCDDYEVSFKCGTNRVFDSNACTPINYCGSANKCNGGNCHLVLGGFECRSCPSHRTGLTCQTDIDDCANMPCQNNGICIDKIGTTGYDCNCTVGYIGSTCANEDNFCTVGLCNNGDCRSLEKTYKCDCYQGYTGKNCETDINECQSDPCLHGGECEKFGVADYRCDCPDGWVGKNCEIINRLCAGSSCNGAQCHDLFNDYYCECEANAYGKDCENAPDPCFDYNKCLRGTCSYMRNMTCECPITHSGECCEVLVDHCGETNNCVNGACHITDTGYRCECEPGYTGTNCDQEIDECASGPCSGNAVCYDGVAEYYCVCPLELTGTGCSRTSDSDFDYYFRGDGFAKIGHFTPVNNATQMSVSLWVRFIEPDSEGVYFTMYMGKRLNSAKKFLEFNENSVTVYHKNTHSRVQYREPHKLNDGNWHSVIVNLDFMAGSIALYKNSVAMFTTAHNDLIMDALNTYIYVILGCDFDNTVERCTSGGHLNGFVSQVNVYSEILAFPEDIPRVVRVPTLVFEKDKLLVWNNYVDVGATRFTGTRATITPCSVTGNCRFFEAKTRPVISRPCPSDVHVFNRRDRLMTVTWTEPVFQGASQVVSNFSPGVTLHWGEFDVIYIATSDNGNKATCRFKVYVNNNDCGISLDERPNGGTTDCTENGDFRNCQLKCFDPDDFVIDRYTPNIFTCGPSGNWNVKKRFQSFTFPSCGAKQTNRPLAKVEVRLVYNILTIACQDAEVEFVVQIKNTLQALGLCPNNNCQSISIVVTCGPIAAGRNRRQAEEDRSLALIELTIPSASQEVPLGSGNVRIAEFITYMVLGDDAFRYNQTIAGATIDPSAFHIIVTDVCPYGQSIIDGNCVECGAGNYFTYMSDNVTGYCEDCAVGFYQNQKAQDSCIPCDDGQTTMMTGSRDSSACKKICDPGYFFNTTLDDCQPCAIGFYQSESGQFYCDFCERGKTTHETQSTSVDDCYDVCPSGKELNANGQCELCAIGTFRHELSQTVCEQCPAGKITPGEGSVTVSQCNITACEAGYRRNSSNQCEECAIGYYQNEKWQDECIPCGSPTERWRTDQLGTIQQADCKFFCESGYEKPDNEETCIACEIGKYKDNADSFYGKCLECPDNRRTAENASDSQNDCTIYKCPAGFKPNANNTDCLPCGLGEYQPVPESTTCEKCVSGTSTRELNSTMASQCEEYCDPGYEESLSGCNPCDRGFYKDNEDGLFGLCRQCPENYTTAGAASRVRGDCNIRACQPGTKRNADETDCEPCPLGEYQHLPYMAQCNLCPSNTSTVSVGANSQDLCKDFCPGGEELTPTGCKACERGYFKDNDLDVFSLCELCPGDFITAGEGGTSEAACNIRNCSAGYKLNELSNECEVCPKGYYQNETWQTECIQCPVDKTTENEGSTSKTNCILECQPGFEDDQGVCVECPRGEYKEVLAAAQCTPCQNGSTTEGRGANDSSLCNLPACTAGYYLDRTGTPVCKECPYDSYTDEIWQESCKPCPSNLVTLATAASKQEDCVQDCLSGREYDATSQNCKLCPIGYYRDRADRTQAYCQLCPEEFITSIAGSTSVDDCNIVNCTTPGQYRRVMDNTCQPCPIGEFASEKWLTSCTRCQDGFSTLDLGSTDVSACIRTCPSGSYVTAENICATCPVGTYRNVVSGSLNCTQCPGGRLTEDTGSTSQADCTRSPCDRGHQYIEAERRCEPCPKATYQPESGQFGCLSCPPNRAYTVDLGAVEETECRTNCNAGQKFDIDTEECSLCSKGTYQPEPNQFTCISCEAGKQYTDFEGATRSSECISLCDSNQNDCSVNATCRNTQGSFECTCLSNYDSIGTLPGRECLHKCDNDFCKNGATCTRSGTPTCICNDWFEGNNCETRVDSRRRSDKVLDIVVPVVIGVGAFLLFIIIFVVCCIVRARRKPKSPSAYSEYIPEKTEQASLHSFDRHPQKITLAPYNELEFQNPGYTSYAGADTAVYQA